jgi:uncharacterized membrane protein
VVFCFGQNAFHVLRKELDNKIQNSDYTSALELINQNREHYNPEEKTNLDVLKVKI